jgi:hypothetical protein
MFDTVIFRKLTKLPYSDELLERGFFFVGSNRVGERWEKNVDVNGLCVLTLSWYKVFNDAYLSAEISLPKSLYGNNVEMITPADIPVALENLSNLVTRHTKIYFNAARARVTRLDVCWNWRTSPSDVCARLQSLQTAHVPRKMCRIIESNGATIYFQNRGKKRSEVISLYSKHAETANLKRKVHDDVLRSSVGVIRLEHRYFGDMIRRKFGTDIAGELLCAAVAEKVINSDLKTLTLDKEIQTGDTRFETLRKYCGDDGGLFRRLAPFLILCDMYGANNLVSLGFCGKSTFYELRKHLKSAGALLETKTKHTLEPLSAPNFNTCKSAFIARSNTSHQFHPHGIINHELPINP